MNMKDKLLKEWDKLTKEYDDIILGDESEVSFEAGRIVAIENLLSSCYDIHKEFFDDDVNDGVTGWNDEG